MTHRTAVGDLINKGRAARRDLASRPDTADTQPCPVTGPGTLYPLAYLAVGKEIIRGDESRSALDDYYRAQRFPEGRI
jgi:hypothetical protein